MANKTEKMKILHVDDEEDSLKVVKTILEKEGLEVTSVNTGLRALKEINLDGFKLLIFDIMMPDMSGWDLFSRIAKIKPDYKVVFLSVLEISKERIKELKDAGVKDYIRKPFDRNDFVARVKKAINS
ncbi:MAG: response regulator [Candidatus Aenigmarchaeota archaeon]|nr:response regulator [Candidatus Aenigmarchaeota archaeon]